MLMPLNEEKLGNQGKSSMCDGHVEESCSGKLSLKSRVRQQREGNCESYRLVGVGGIN